MSNGRQAEGKRRDYCARFQFLHTDQHLGRPRPHKAMKLLAEAC